MKQFFIWIWLVVQMLPAKKVCAQMDEESKLVNHILVSLQKSDDSGYAALFPKYEDLVKAATNYQPETDEDRKRIMNILDSPGKLQRYDPEYNPAIIEDFRNVLKKGKDSGLHWGDILMARYELQKIHLRKVMKGFEKIATIRLAGFVYVKDMLTRRMYMIAVADVFYINNKWYGGKVVNIMEAGTEEEYYRKLAGERELMQLLAEKGPAFIDSFRKATAVTRKKEVVEEDEEDDDRKKVKPDVVARKLYTGKFDNQIPVELYVRHLKGDCAEPACAWEAMYRLEDMDYFILLQVTKSADGVWSFTEEDVGVMELTLIGDKYTGAWISFADKTEYDVRLAEEDAISSKKLFKLDEIFNSGSSVDY